MDLKSSEFALTEADEFELLGLGQWTNCLQATRGVQEVDALTADRGGLGFISGVKRVLFSSSACIYPVYRQQEADVTALKEEDAYPA